MGCTRTFVEARIAGNCETVAVTVASSWPPSLSQVPVAAKVASNSVESAASVADASKLAAAVAETIGASNWSAIAATFADTDYSAATVRRMVTFASAAKRAGGRSAFVAAGATIACSCDRCDQFVGELDTKSSTAAKAKVASSWQSVLAAMAEARSSVAEGMAASKRWVVEAKVGNNSWAAAVVTYGRNQQAVEERTAGTESVAAAATVASTSAVFEEIARKVSAAAEKLADNSW